MNDSTMCATMMPHTFSICALALDLNRHRHAVSQTSTLKSIFLIRLDFNFIFYFLEAFQRTTASISMRETQLRSVLLSLI
jgi:hypothetical protein